MVIALLDILAPVFAIVGVGYFWGRSGEPFDGRFATRLMMLVAAPSLVFITLAKMDLATVDVGGLLAGTLLSYGALTVLFWGLLRGVGLSQRVFLAPLVFGNTGNMGLPIALFAYGEDGLAAAVVVFALSTVLMAVTGAMLAARSAWRLDTLRHPILPAALLGLGVAAAGVTLPDWIDRTFTLAGQIAIPLMLLALGVSVSRFRATALPRIALLSLIKIGLAVSAAVGVAALLGLEGADRGVLILQIAAPVAVLSYLFAEQAEADPEQVAALVLVSTLLSLGTLPLLLLWLL